MSARSQFALTFLTSAGAGKRLIEGSHAALTWRIEVSL